MNTRKPALISRITILAAIATITVVSCSETTTEPIAADPGGDTSDTIRRDCPADLPGPNMVLVKSPVGAAYCIDSTEVTQGQYFEFLRGVGSKVRYANLDEEVGAKIAIPTGCEQNTNLGPVFSIDEPCTVLPYAYDRDEQHLDYPVACVNWCAAYAYCAWAGKRLCGRIGGGSLTETDLGDPNKSQWFNACSQGGSTKYAYGDDFEEGVCSEGAVSSAASAEPNVSEAEAPTECRGTTPPYDQISNLSGNVAEWQDGCSKPGKYWSCYSQSITAQGSQSERDACASFEGYGITDNKPWVGIRCCLD